MKILLLGCILLISPQVYSEELGVDEITLAIDEMVRNNVISATEGQKAKLKLKNSSKSFLATTNRMPASVHTQLIDSSQASDLSKVQTKHIEKEIDIMFKKVIEK